MKKLLLLILLPAISMAQTVIPLQNSAINSTLLNANFVTSNTIDISNVTVTGSDYSIGVYNNFSNFQIPEGIVLSTGGAEWALDSTNSIGVIQNWNIVPDPHLVSLQSQLISGNSSNILRNITAIEFDFVPQFDGVSFSYIFASKEYTNYTCSKYNDVFGFFLTGPGISGNYHNNSENLAIVPNSVDIPVCINSINSGTVSILGDESYCEFIDPDFASNSYLFNENKDTSLSNYIHFPFNGFTDTLSINTVLEPDSIYHLKIVIADVNDKYLNSAVFLTEQSFLSYQFDTISWGCTDVEALNYSNTAIYDDGSCYYTPIGIKELNGLRDILSSIPNPIQSSTIQLENIESPISISIYNSNGVKVLQSSSGYLNLANLIEGIYIIEISNGKYKTAGKYIIQ